MSGPLRLFLADYVPLRNKGEQAIVYGIQDMLADGSDVQVTMFGPEQRPTEHGNIKVFPHEWIFETRLLDFQKHKLQRVSTWLQLRLGLYGRLNRLIESRDPQYAEVVRAFHQADLVLVGHDGFFCVESCAILRLARRAGKGCGILGSGFNIPRMQWLVKLMYKKAIMDSDFCVFREKTAWQFMRSLDQDPGKIRLEPDTAFAMRPAAEDEVRAVLERTGWYRPARAAGRPIVVVTVCEKSIVYRSSFRRESDPTQKRQVHSSFVASLLDSLVRERNVQLLFLPHSIESGIGNDIDVAHRVAASMTSSSDRRAILEGDYSARLLKGIIREADFCIGERTHSLIGSLSVATPFLGLTNSDDIRTHDILGDMGKCEDRLLDMDDPSIDDSIQKVLQIFDQRDQIRRQLQVVSDDFNSRLQQVAALVKGQSA